MPIDHDKTSERIFAEGLWQKRLLAGELSPAEYAARVVAEPVRYRRAFHSQDPRWPQYRSSRRPLIRARVLLVLAALAGLIATVVAKLTEFNALAIVPGFAAASLLVVAAFVIARSSAAQEIWLLNHEIREQRAQLDAFEGYGAHLRRCWGSLGEEVLEGEITAGLIRRRLQETRLAIEAMKHDEVALAILRRERDHYFLAYASFVPHSRLGEELETAVSASDLLQGVSKDLFSHFAAFEFAGAAHELVALSADPFSPSEQWLLDQLGVYCSTAGTLARS